MISFESVHGVIFDVDGTLYSQRRLRTIMAFQLLSNYAFRPWRLRELIVLTLFRRHREYLSEIDSLNIVERQYKDVAERVGCSEQFVQDVVSQWIEFRPLPYLLGLRNDGVLETFKALRQTGRKIAVLSDYPTQAKMRMMELVPDVQVAATDDDINRLKPNKLGLDRVIHRLGISPKNCLMVGDRDDKDGACARALGIPFLLYSRKDGTNQFNDFFWLADRLQETDPIY